MSDTSSGESTRKPVRTEKRHVDCGARLYRVGSDRMLFCQNCQQQVFVGETPPHELGQCDVGGCDAPAVVSYHVHGGDHSFCEYHHDEVSP